MAFAINAFLFAGFLAVGACLFAVGPMREPDLFRRLPRARILGAVVAVVCLVWSAYHVCLMLEGGLVKFRVIVKLLVPVIAILAYTHLDYLFTRALGGLVVLVVNHLLHAAFVVHLPGRPVFALVCYLLGLLGLLLVAAPWHFRDALERAAESGRYRRGMAAALGVLSITFAVFAVAA